MTPPSGGTRRTVLEPGSFARHLGLYLAHLVADQGGDKSGRWLSARIDRSKGYCEKLLNQVQAMTTNDIALAAELFQVSPYEFVRLAREWDSGEDSGDYIPPTPSDSQGQADDEVGAQRRKRNVSGSVQDRKVASDFSEDRGEGE